MIRPLILALINAVTGTINGCLSIFYFCRGLTAYGLFEAAISLICLTLCGVICAQIHHKWSAPQ